MLPIVVLTSVEDLGIEKEALKRGAQQCLRKTNLGELLEVMRKAVAIRLLDPAKVHPEVESSLNGFDESIKARNIRREVHKRMF